MMNAKKSDLYTKLISGKMSYNEVRKANKLTLFASFFILFKSTVGLGIFSYPFVFSKVGIGYGIILGIFICYITSYGIYGLAHQCNVLEDEGLSKGFNSYDDIVKFLADNTIGKKYSKILCTLSVICCIIINGSVIVGAIIEIGNVLSQYFKVHLLVVKITIMCVYLLMAATILEPEKLKPFAFVSSFAVISISILSIIHSSCHNVLLQHVLLDSFQHRSLGDPLILRHQPRWNLLWNRWIRLRSRGHCVHQ